VASCTSGDGIVLSSAGVQAALATRPGRPVLLVDLAVPRDIDPDVANIPGVTLLNMDDISAFVTSRVDGRRAEVPAVERIVAEEVERYETSLAARAVAPLVSALHDRAEEIRASEIARLEGRTRELGEAERELLETITRRIVAKLLHEPTVNLKSAAGTARGEALADAFRELFGLEP
jgi:glutamyl-tRNA reductase